MGRRWEELPTARRSTSCVPYEHCPRRNMSFITPDYFIHAANILLLVAYSVRDVLWVALVRGGSFPHCHSLLSVSAYRVVGAPSLERDLCRDQSLSIVAAVRRASSSQADGRGGGN